MNNEERFQFGVAWYPEWDDDTRWRRDLDDIVASGFNVVRIAEFAWDVLEPTPGTFDFRRYDDVMTELEKRNVGVVFGVDTVRPPEWIFELYPDIHLTDEYGRFAPLRWPRHCFNHPAFKELSERFIANVIPRYKDSPALLYYQVDNETCYQDRGLDRDHWFCYCAYCQREFASWLKHRYEGQTAPAISVPFAPQSGMGELAWLEWRKFHDDTNVRRVSWVYDEVKKHDPEHAITTNVMVGSSFRAGTSSQAHDVFRLIKSMDIVGMDFYPNMSEEGGEIDSMVYSISDQLSEGEGFYCLETQATTYAVEGGGWQGQETAFLEFGPSERVVPQFWRAVAYGARSLLYWVWRLRVDNVWSLARPDGSLVPAAGQVRALADSLSSVWPDISSARRVDAKVAVVFNRASEHLAHLHGLRGEGNEVAHAMIGRNGREVLNAFAAARRHTTSIDVVDLGDGEAELGQYSVVIAPFLYTVSKDEAARLAGFVKSGGTLLWGGRSGEYGESADGWQEVSVGARLRLPADEPLPSGLSDVLGFRSQGARLADQISLDSPAGPLASSASVSGGGWYRTVETGPGAEVVTLNTDGAPGILRTPCESGTTVSVLIDVFDSLDAGLVELVAGILTQAGIPSDFEGSPTAELNAARETVRRLTEEGELVFLINSSPEVWNARTRVPSSDVREILKNQELNVSTVDEHCVVGSRVPPYGVQILQVRTAAR